MSTLTRIGSTLTEVRLKGMVWGYMIQCTIVKRVDTFFKEKYLRTVA